MSDYDMSIHTNPDARAWAKFFMETWEKIGRPLPDEEMMIGWFANAIMAMHDHLKPNEAADEITRLRAALRDARAEVLEEAAKVAEGFPAPLHGSLNPNSYAASEQTADEIAAAIRALKEQA